MLRQSRRSHKVFRVSYIWWECLSIVADKEVERVALSQKSETERLQFEEQERLAQEKIQEFVEKQVSVEVAV